MKWSSWAAMALGLVWGVVACGGAEGTGPAGGVDDVASNCGPHGRLVEDVAEGPNCDCDEGHAVEDGVCVEVVEEVDPVEPTQPNCGPHGTFDGRSCRCDSGHTQTGTGLERTCEPIPECRGPNDPHEPNDLPSEAVPLTEIGVEPLYACPAEGDWFTFPVEAGDRVVAEIRFNGQQVDLDLFAFGPSSRDARAFSISESSSVERADFQARATGTAGVLVSAYGVGEGAYELDVEIEAGELPECAPAGGFCRSSADCCSRVCHIDHCH